MVEFQIRTPRFLDEYYLWIFFVWWCGSCKWIFEPKLMLSPHYKLIKTITVVCNMRNLPRGAKEISSHLLYTLFVYILIKSILFLLWCMFIIVTLTREDHRCKVTTRLRWQKNRLNQLKCKCFYFSVPLSSIIWRQRKLEITYIRLL